MNTYTDEPSLLNEERIVNAATTHFPSPIDHKAVHAFSEEEKIAQIAHHFEQIMKTLGLDVTDSSLQETPERVARMYVNEIFSGLDFNKFPPISLFPRQKSPQEAHEIIIVKASFVSFCEHHFVPMTGTAYVGYVPSHQIIGLSKISRIVRYFASRPQLQERLSAQIADCLTQLLGNENVAVFINARHYCVLARGVKDESADTSTLFAKGIFQSSPEKKKEFLDLVQLAQLQKEDAPTDYHN